MKKIVEMQEREFLLVYNSHETKMDIEFNFSSHSRPHVVVKLASKSNVLLVPILVWVHSLAAIVFANFSAQANFESH